MRACERRLEPVNRFLHSARRPISICRKILPSLAFLLLRGMRGSTLTRFFDETSIRQAGEPRGSKRIKADARSRVQRQDHVVDLEPCFTFTRPRRPRASSTSELPRFDFISPWSVIHSSLDRWKLTNYPVAMNFLRCSFLLVDNLSILKKRRREEEEEEIRATVRLILTLLSRSDWPAFVSQ